MPRITRFEQRRFVHKGREHTLYRFHRRIRPADEPETPRSAPSRRGLDWPVLRVGLNPHGPALLALGARWDRVHRVWHVPPAHLAAAQRLVSR